MWFPGSLLSKPIGQYKRPGIYRAKRRPSGASHLFLFDGPNSEWQYNEVYTGKPLVRGDLNTSPIEGRPGGAGWNWGSGTTSLASLVGNPANTCSMEALAYCDGLPGSLFTMNFGTSSSVTFDRMLFVQSDGKAGFYIYDGAAKTAVSPSAVVAAGGLCHFGGTSSGSQIKFYFNGRLLATTSTSNGGYAGYGGSAYLYFGNHGGPGGVTLGTGPFHLIMAQYSNACWTDGEMLARAQAPFRDVYNSEDWGRSFIVGSASPGTPPGAQAAVSMM